MDILFRPMQINNIALPNRFVRSATFDRSDEKGHVTNALIRNYSNLADGGVGLIITGLTNINSNGQMASFQTSIADDEAILSFTELASAVHNKGAKVRKPPILRPFRSIWWPSPQVAETRSQ